MKLLVFAHIPPPHHGQSYMVKLMLDGLGGDCRRGGHPRFDISCYHVNAQVSDTMEDIGTFRFGKLLLILRYCLEAIWCRFRYGVNAFYYVPAPGKRAALYRDWIVMLFCRPFFRHRIYHWHASGLGDWLEKEGSWFERWFTHLLLGKSKLGLSLAIPSMRDALWFRSEHVEIVANGIPDPCPDFDKVICPYRIARAAIRGKILAGEPISEMDRENDGQVFRILYLAHCTREKGVFEAIEGVRLANEQLREKKSALRMRLTLAGAFLFTDEERELEAALGRANLGGACVEHVGFVSGEKKEKLFRECDCFCFPTYYSAEGQPISLLEAMAFGLQIVTTRWRGIPELLPSNHPGYCAAKNPHDVARALLEVAPLAAKELRAHFLCGYTAVEHVKLLSNALEQGCSDGEDIKKRMD